MDYFGDEVAEFSLATTPDNSEPSEDKTKSEVIKAFHYETQDYARSRLSCIEQSDVTICAARFKCVSNSYVAIQVYLISNLTSTVSDTPF